MRDPYEVLGIARDADSAAIKRSYRRLAHRLHPDKNPGDASATERFKEVAQAYDVLADPAKRARYDRYGAAGLGAGPPGGGGEGGPAAGFGQNVGEVFSDIFGDFFGRRGGRAGEGRGRVPARGEDLALDLEVPFEAAAHGGERMLQVRRRCRCGRCQGTGARPGTSPQICSACGGSGAVRAQQGLFQVRKACGFCRGRGRMVSDPCAGCDGRGSAEQEVDVRVRVPAGAETGTVLRYAGEGSAGRDGGQPGDLRVTLRVGDHPLFVRRGADLALELPVTPSQAVLGTSLEVPTLGGAVRLKLPPGTASGRVLRLRGKGLPRLRRAQESGDLLVTVAVEMPRELSAAQRQLYESLAALDGPPLAPRRAAGT